MLVKSRHKVVMKNKKNNGERKARPVVNCCVCPNSQGVVLLSRKLNITVLLIHFSHDFVSRLRKRGFVFVD